MTHIVDRVLVGAAVSWILAMVGVMAVGSWVQFRAEHEIAIQRNANEHERGMRQLDLRAVEMETLDAKRLEIDERLETRRLDIDERRLELEDAREHRRIELLGRIDPAVLPFVVDR